MLNRSGLSAVTALVSISVPFLSFMENVITLLAMVVLVSNEYGLSVKEARAVVTSPVGGGGLQPIIHLPL